MWGRYKRWYKRETCPPPPLEAVTGDQHQLPSPGEGLGKGHTTLLLGTGHRKLFLKCKIWGVIGRLIAVIKKRFKKPFIFVQTAITKMPQTGCLINNKLYIYIKSSGGSKSEIRVLAWSDGSSIPGYSQHFPTGPSQVEKASELCGVSFIGTAIPSHEGS